MIGGNIIVPKSRWKRLVGVTFGLSVIVSVFFFCTSSLPGFSHESDSGIAIFAPKSQLTKIRWKMRKEENLRVKLKATTENFAHELEHVLERGFRKILYVGKCEELCDSISRSSVNGSFYSTEECPPHCEESISTPHAPFFAHLTVLAAKIEKMNVSSLIAVGDPTFKTEKVQRIFHRFNIPVTDPIDVPKSLQRFRQLFKHKLRNSRASILFTSSWALKMFLKMFATYGGNEHRRIFAYLKSEDKKKLLNSHKMRKVSENLGLVVSSYKRFSRLRSLQEELKFIHHKKDFTIDIQTLIPSALLNFVVLQASPWLVESRITVSKDNDRWKITDYHDLTSSIIMKKDLLRIVPFQCQPKIQITSFEPLKQTEHTRDFVLDTFPYGVMIPNSHLGFDIKMTCTTYSQDQITELHCTRGENMKNSMDCMIATGNIHRRVVRSFTAHNELYMDRKLIRRTSDRVKEDLITILPQAAGCIGTTTGCAFCFVFLVQVSVKVSPGVCYGACAVGVGGSCTTLISRGIQRKLEDTIICSELFRQRRLTLQSYIADANYGRKLSSTNPLSLVGYNFLASPVVQQMKSSRTFSDWVHMVATPWIEHMEYSENVRAVDNLLGALMSYCGIFICSIVGLCVIYPDFIKIVICLVAVISSNRCKSL